MSCQCQCPCCLLRSFVKIEVSQSHDPLDELIVEHGLELIAGSTAEPTRPVSLKSSGAVVGMVFFESNLILIASLSELPAMPVEGRGRLQIHLRRKDHAVTLPSTVKKRCREAVGSLCSLELR